MFVGEHRGWTSQEPLSIEFYFSQMLEKPLINATQGSPTSYNKLDFSAHIDKHCTGWIFQGNYESVKENNFLMLCKVVRNSAMALMIE